jgi:tRNA (guanine-N7-)-methyltransferase
MARRLKDYPSVSLKLQDLDGKMDFVQIFGRAGPVHVEIGPGKGTFLVNQARANPEHNFIGIERAGKYYRWAVDRIGRWGLNNVRIVRADAAQFLRDFVPAESVDCFHIYFPDPWPKRRHHKRRFFCETNLAVLVGLSKTGGCIRVATDHAEYYKIISSLVDKHDRLETVEFLPSIGTKIGEWVGTNFERKYLKKNRPIYTLAARKRMTVLTNSNGKAVRTSPCTRGTSHR